MKKASKKLAVITALLITLNASYTLAAPKVTEKAPDTTATQTIVNNVAIVDVSKVVSSSAQVAALKKEQEAKSKELITFVEKARKDIAATTDAKKKQALEEKYNKQLAEKKEAIDKNYAKKLADIDTNISKQIEAIAKAEGYSVVVAKGVVLYGGADITEKVIKALK